MALTFAQFQELRKKGLSNEQIVSFERGEQPAQVAGNQFEEAKPTGILGKARDFVTGIIGGGKLAQGLGKSIAAPGVQKTLSTEQDETSGLQSKILERIRENRAAGKDTSRLEIVLKNSQNLATSLQDAQSDFADSLPTNKEVVGSAIGLGGTLAGGAITGRLAKAFALGKASTFTGGLARGAAVGGTAGAIEGGIQGTRVGLEQNLGAGGVAANAAIGAGIGAAAGGVLGGATGATVGAIRGAKDPNRIFQHVTPSTKELTPTQYKRAVNQGQIIPKTATKPAQYVLSESQKNIALKFQDIITPDPVKTTININNKLGELDDQVGAFLTKNNGIFNKGELKNAILSSMEDISDVTVDEARLLKDKTKLVENFLGTLEKGDMKSLWKARKNFDNAIDSAFRGSPTLQKEIKIAFRNAVQDFIADKTPNEVYKLLMKDMSGLFRLRDTVLAKATPERGLSGLGAWIKKNPIKANALGWGGAGILLGGGVTKLLGGQSEGGSSGG